MIGFTDGSLKRFFKAKRDVARYVKRPIPVRAIQIIDDSFRVVTLEGEVEGKKGDWIIEGVRGEFYPIDREIFEVTYKMFGEQ